MKNQHDNCILLAEDNPFNQKVAVAMLKKLGVSADVASNGLEVLEKISQKSYSLILMDCEMPKMNGFEATNQIRTGEQNNGQHTPIIAMTAHSSQEDRESCFNAGMDDYLSKPFKIEELQSILARWKLIEG